MSRKRLLAAWVLVLLAVPAFAQTRVRVIKDKATIWRSNFSVVAAVVAAGTELDVVGRQGPWYEVEVPFGPDPRERGLIAANQVEAIGGAPAPGRHGAAVRTRTTPAPPTSGIGVRGFVELGYERLAAKQSFGALLGKSTGVWYGAGVEFREKGGFLSVSVERFGKSGQRVFVYQGDVYPLGVSTRITITPLDATAGYRFGHGTVVPYVGGGAGEYFYRDTSAFADPSENVSRHFPSYHALGGVEVRGGWLATAVEVQYTRVHNDLAGGISDVYDEHDLGGVQARVKILFGK